jgi:prevent-host-death family protein
MSYTVHQAKTHLSRILKEVEEGKEVIVTRGKTPVARITAVESGPPVESAQFRLMGAYRDKIRWDKDAFDPLTDPELVELGWDYVVDAPLATLPDKPKDQ